MSERSHATSSSSLPAAEPVPTPPSPADEILRLLLPTTDKYAQMLRKGIDGEETCWLRLNVLVEKGRVKKVQLIKDEQIELPNASAGQ